MQVPPPGSLPPPTPGGIDPEATAEPVGGPFRYGLASPDAIVPPTAVEPAGLTVVDALFDALLQHGPDGELQPAAAVTWSAVAELATTWTFALRPGATFHDGSPVTAEDFAFAWALAVRSGAAGYHLRNVNGYEAVLAGEADRLAGVVAVDPLTLEVRLDVPHADFPHVVAHPSLAPVPRADWEARQSTGIDGTPAFADQPNGNGPFQMQGPWARGQFVRTQRFGGWSNGAPPSLDSVLFDIGDVDSNYLAFQQGRLDYAPLPPEAVDQAREEFPHRPAVQRPDDRSAGTGVLSGAAPVSYLLAFRVDDAPYDNPDVRQALAAAIDREAVAAAFFDGNLEPATSLAPPAIPGALAGACANCSFDLAEANRRLGAERVDDITIGISAGGGHEEVVELLQADLADIGVDLEVAGGEPAPFEEHLDDVRAGRLGFFRWGWAPEYPTLDEALYPLLHSTQTPEVGGQNVMGYANPVVDAVLDQARRELDEDRRARLYRLAERIALNSDQPVIPVVSYREAAVVAERVGGLVLDPMGRVNLAELVIIPGA